MRTRTKKGKAAVSYLKEITTAGTPESLQPSLTGTTIAIVAGTPATITDSGSKFLLKGFKAGDKIRATGSAADDGVYNIASVVAGTITLVTGETVTGELAGGSITIEKIDKVFCRDLTVQVPSANTSSTLAVLRSSDVDLSAGIGIVMAKLNTYVYYGVYLDEVYVDVGTNADKIFVEYTPVLI